MSFHMPLLLLQVFIAGVTISAQAQREAPPLPVITNLTQLRALSSNEAALGYPVKIQAFVTLYEPLWNTLVVQDSAEAAYVYPGEIQRSLRFGDSLRIEGSTAANPDVRFPFIIPNKLTQLGGNRRVLEAKHVPLTRLASGDEEFRWVEVEGTVQSMVERNGRYILQLADGGVVIKVVLVAVPDLTAEQALGSQVRLQGLCIPEKPHDRQPSAPQLIVPEGFGLVVMRLRSSQFDFGEINLGTNVWVKATTNTTDRRVMTRGEIIGIDSTNRISLQTTNGAITLILESINHLFPGIVLDATGIPLDGITPPTLTNVQHRRVGIGAKFGLASTDIPPILPPRTLNTVSEIRRLSETEAARSYPVQIQGRITYADPEWGRYYLHGNSEGIFVNTHGSRPEVKTGNFVGLTGFSGSPNGRSIVRPAFTILGETSLPTPEPQTVNQLQTGRFDSQWVEVEGVIHAITNNGDHLILAMHAEKESFDVVIPDFIGRAYPTELIDAKVKVQGVCGSIFNARQQFNGFRLYVPLRSCIRVLEAPSHDPSAKAVQEIASLRKVNLNTSGHRVKIRGSVTYQAPGYAIYVTDSTGSICVHSDQKDLVRPGDIVEVFGFPTLDEYTVGLADANFQKVGAGSATLPVAISSAEMASGNYDSELIQTEGLLSDRRKLGNQIILIMQSGYNIFTVIARQEGAGKTNTAHVPIPSAAGRKTPGLLQLAIGSTLKITGVCSVQPDEAKKPASVRILTRSADDISVLHEPPWWNLQRTLAVLGGLALTCVVGGLWVVALRRRVAQQTEIIQARLKEEAALEQRYRDLFENANDIIYTHDLHGNFTSLNKAGEIVFGFTRDQIRSMNAADIFIAPPGQEPNDVVGIIDDLYSVNPQAAVEIDARTNDGRLVTLEISRRIVSEAGTPIGVQGIARDITLRKAAEIALNETEERFAKTFNASPVAIGVTRFPEGVFLDVNQSLIQMTGYTREELIGKSGPELGLWNKPEQRQTLVQRLEHSGRVSDFPVELKTRKGIIRHVLVAADLIEIGKTRCMLMISHDITDYLRLEEELRQAQKLEGIGQLAAGVAHDFNNILTVIQGRVGISIDRGTNDPELGESLREISDAADRAARLTRQLLLFSRKQALKMAPVDLDAAVAGMSKLLRRTLGEDISVRINSSPRIPMIMADLGMMEQVILNLAVNARDAMPKGGVLTIATSVARAASLNLQPPPADPEQQFVSLTVTDTGSGIPSEHIDRIFEPFFTTKEVGKGTGLGLATVHGIVKQHHGTITVQSRVAPSPNQGTTFTIHLPALAPDPTAEGQHANKPTTGGKEMILVVEDEPAVARLVSRYLSGIGYTVLSASSGVAALPLWTKYKNNIELLVTDIVMPHGLNGHELAQQLQNERANLKVVYMSGYSTDSMSLEFRSRTGLYFIPKPFHPATLADVVRDCLDGKPPPRVG